MYMYMYMHVTCDVEYISMASYASQFISKPEQYVEYFDCFFVSVHQERALDEALLCVESFISPQSDTYTLALAAYAHSLADVSSDARARAMELMNSKAVVQGGCTSVGQDHLAKVGVLYSA